MWYVSILSQLKNALGRPLKINLGKSALTLEHNFNTCINKLQKHKFLMQNQGWKDLSQTLFHFTLFLFP